MYTLILALAIGQQVPPVVELASQAPAVRQECRCYAGEPCICGDSCSCYMDACRRAVRENKRLYCYVGKNVMAVPGAIAGRFIGQFPDVQGPAVVIAEPDGNGWLRIIDVQYDRPVIQSIPRLQSFAPAMMFRIGGGRNC